MRPFSTEDSLSLARALQRPAANICGPQPGDDLLQKNCDKVTEPKKNCGQNLNILESLSSLQPL